MWLSYALRASIAALVLLSSQTFALELNKADILLNNDLNTIDVVVNPGGTGCPTGQYWDIGRGACTTEVVLRDVSVSENCSCSCPAGTSGSCTMQRNGSYSVFGWRLPTAGNELVSRYGATSWGSCYSVSSNCVADPDTGGGDTGGGTGVAPPPGTSFLIQAFICDASHESFPSGVLSPSNKSKIIATYRQFNYGGRCPEASGYVYWQSSWNNWASEYQAANPGTSTDLALASTWSYPTQEAMNRAAIENGENLSSYSSTLNQLCSSYATSKYGVQLTATYVLGSGSTCIVN